MRSAKLRIDERVPCAYDADKFRAAVTHRFHDYSDESPEPAKTECWEESPTSC